MGSAVRTDPPESVRGHALVVCMGGPRHGGVYFEDHGSSSWSERRRLAEVDGETKAGATLGYRVSDEMREHPRWTVMVRVLRWQPEVT